MPADEEFRLEFREDGTAHAFENGERTDDGVAYNIDEDRRVIGIYIAQELEVELRYDLFDDVMVLTMDPPEELREADFPEDQFEIVLSRWPEGNEEHQRMRAAVAPGHPANGGTARSRARRTQSASNLRQLSVTLMAYWVDNQETAPISLGITLSVGYIDDPEVFLLPWQEAEVPEGWAKLDNEAQAEWLDLNSGYGYVGAEMAAEAMLGNNPNLRADEAVVLFELPLIVGTDKIAVAFGDGHVEHMPYAAADDLIETQTGLNLVGWMDHLGREQLPWDAGEAGRGSPPDEADATPGGGDRDGSGLGTESGED